MKNKIAISFILTIILLLITIYLNLIVGEYQIDLNTVFNSFYQPNDSIEHTVITTVRVPRIITGLCVGATLSISGYLIKVVFNNPLADSGILGIQSGASTFALLVMLVIPGLFYALPLFAFLGGLLALVILLILSYRKGKINPLMMVLSGIAISAFFNAINGIIQLLNKDSVQYALGWLNGSIANVSSSNAMIILIYSIIALVVALLLIPVLKIIRLDDQMIENLGKSPYRLRVGVTIVAVILACISVAFVGIIGFIGIIIPHFAKMLVGHKDKFAMPMSIILGATIVLITDLFQKVVFYPQEISVGIIIGLVGTPLFILFMRKELVN